MVRNGEVAIAPMVTLSLSCDHRVIDGVLGARFLDVLKRCIESPERLES